MFVLLIFGNNERNRSSGKERIAGVNFIDSGSAFSAYKETTFFKSSSGITP